MHHRVGGFLIAAALAACGSDSPKGESVCDNVVPPPAACQTACDPAPDAPNTCPAGYHCQPGGTCDARCTPTGGECGDGYRCTGDGRCVGEDSCVGLECQIDDCAAQGMPLTTVTGVVYAPNGTLPLPNVDVYVPNAALPPPVEGAICDRCTTTLPGSPVVQAKTDDQGRFTLAGVPSGASIPVVISTGKWRRQITIPTVTACTSAELPVTETRLPRNRSEGTIPRIAISTGGADAFECLPRKLGIEDSEFGKDGDPARIHMYSDVGVGGEGANRFRSGFPGGSGDFGRSQDLWGSVDKMKQYDLMFLSCEGDHYPESKPQAAMDAMKAYADLGGRVFLTHWHNIWIGGSFRGGDGQAPAVWTEIAEWDQAQNLGSPTVTIDQVSNPKGVSFATWMVNVMGSTMLGEFTVNQARITASAIDATRAERWVYLEQNGTQYPNMFQFTTPNEMPPSARCGKVVFTDMHVSADSGSSTGTPFPDDCASGDLTAQEKALAYMFFDIASCVAGPIL